MFSSAAWGQTPSEHPIHVSGKVAHRWMLGDADAYLIRGDCRLEHQDKRLSAETMLLVVDGEPGAIRTRIVLDGVLMGDGSRRGKPLAAVEYTTTVPEVTAPDLRGAPQKRPLLMDQLPANEARIQSNSQVIDMPSGARLRQVSEIRQAQFGQPTTAPPETLPAVPPDNALPSPAAPPPAQQSEPGGFRFLVGGGSRSLEILPRDASSAIRPETIQRLESGETVVVARGGVTVLIRDVTAQLPGGETLALGTISLSADRVVGWLPPTRDLLSGAFDSAQYEGELYLEGDIVFRQGDRIIYAESMYYNVARETGMVLDAEAITTIPEYQGIVRLKADVLRQIARGNYVAFDAAITSSRMGVPRYWLQSQQLEFTDRQRVGVDPLTGLPVADSEPYASSSGNFVFIGGFPVFYWPRFGTRLERPTLYLTGAGFGNDDIFGTQVRLEWDVFQLLGWENAPDGVDARLQTDYLSERGPAIGTSTSYQLPALFGVPGPVVGTYDSWFIDDDGLDTLGGDRKNLVPEESFRGRSLLRHRHYLPNDYEFIAEFGYLSDRNFLEQYFEEEWDSDKDRDTRAILRRYYGNQLFDLSLQVQLNDFFTVNEELPTLNHYLLGSSWLYDRITYSAHNRAGYVKLNVADPPENPAEAATFTTLPGEVNREGLVAITQHRFDAPLQAGPFKIVPYAQGNLAYYGEAVDGNELTRLTGQTGVLASLPFARIDPTISSALLNVRGLAHKGDWSVEYLYADSDASLEELPLYDPLDDNAQEQFRRRFIFSTFGGTLPDRFDPRTYAFRQGIQRWVTSPSDVIVDDLQQVRLGLHQRLQTKRGLPGRERITDLLRLDVDTILFPESDRDNFGETLGPTTYDFIYHVGDRVALLSDGYFDFFSDGLRSVSAGVRTSRPGLGDVYVGLLSLEGPISSTVLRSDLQYRLNEKWIGAAGWIYDFGETGSVEQSFALTRIGESFLLTLGANVDSGRDNVGFGFTVEPRFWPSTQRGRVGGQLIPPPGSEGLE